MLSALERRQANEGNTLWHKNAAIIRQLYQDERKTLKEVKAIMEDEKGFPKTPLPTWEVKLRELRIQKKLKAKDWSLIYQHVYPRLQHEEKKEFRKPTVILIHGTKKPWDKCWKEIRRNRATIQRYHRGPLPPLPSFVTIRTPSPELLGTFVQRQAPKDVHFLVQQLFQTTVVGLQPLSELYLSSLNETSHKSTCPTPDSVYKLCLQGIPFTILLENMSGSLLSPYAVVRTGESQACDDRIIPSSSHQGNFAIFGHNGSLECQYGSIFARLSSEFASASSAGQQLGLNFDTHHYLSMIIYLLSNNLVSRWSSLYEVTVFEIIQVTLRFVSRPLLSALFQSHLLSIKAGWECLLMGIQELKNKEAFEFFIDIGIRNEWLEPHDKGHEYLFSAAQMNCPEIFHVLVDMGCRIASYPSWCCKCDSIQSIIIETINNGGLDCAKLLVQHCNINHIFQIRNYQSTHFAMFITAFDDTRLDHLTCLKFLLEQGANVDYELHAGALHEKGPMLLPSYYGRLSQSELETEWPLSILDYVYYCHHTLFPEVLVYSKVTVQFSRAMALWNLEKGMDALRQYLDVAIPCGRSIIDNTSDLNILERKNRCLEILFAEQFLLSLILHQTMVLWNRVAALSELGITFTWLPKTEEPPVIMLYATACLATSKEGQHKQISLQMIQWLLERGFRVSAHVLLAAYNQGGISIMQYLASFCDDINVEGGEALVDSVYKDDLSAVELLLDLGVDPNSSMHFDFGEDVNVFEAAACSSSLATIRYLIRRGARPRTGTHGSRPSLALVCILTDGHLDGETFGMIQYIVDEHMMVYEPLWPSVPLLELCFFSKEEEDLDLRKTVFEFLLKKGAGINVGSPLAEWIAQGGRRQLVQEMLDAGADPNAYSFTEFDPDYKAWGSRSKTPLQAAAGIGDYELVRLLLAYGANVNAPPYDQVWYSATALHALCAWDPIRREERLRKGRILELFLDKGADIDSADSVGSTALMRAAQMGDISTAFTLLRNGAGLNLLSKKTPHADPFTALDLAARWGRLDMVQFLLTANALSSTAWSNGDEYEGAIRRARKEGYLVISQLIERHSAERHRWNVSSEMSVVPSLHLQDTRQSLSLRIKSPIDLGPQSRSQRIVPESPSSTTVLDQADDPSNARKEDEFESSHGGSKAEAQGTSTTGVTDVSSSSDIEGIGGRASLVDTGCDESRGARIDEAADQAFHTAEAIIGNDSWLFEPKEQSWVKEDQSGAVLLAPSGLDEDVFMGFPGFQSL